VPEAEYLRLMSDPVSGAIEVKSRMHTSLQQAASS
jgi:hypothetical protein